jgi:hypothetical protein
MHTAHFANATRGAAGLDHARHANIMHNMASQNETANNQCPLCEPDRTFGLQGVLMHMADVHGYRAVRDDILGIKRRAR